MAAGFALIERDMLKGPWVMGEQYTVCDPYLFTIAGWLEGDGVVMHGRIAPAVKRLGWRPSPAGRRVLRLDVAALPRPNISELELLANVRATTPEQRVREAAELSGLLVSVGGGAERAR